MFWRKPKCSILNSIISELLRIPWCLKSMGVPRDFHGIIYDWRAHIHIIYWQQLADGWRFPHLAPIILVLQIDVLPKLILMFFFVYVLCGHCTEGIRGFTW